MLDAHLPLPPRLLRTEEAARWLGLSGRTLEKHRCTGTGPAYRKIGGRVVYVVDDLQAWIDAGVRRSTSERSRLTPLALRGPRGRGPDLRPLSASRVTSAPDGRR